MIKQQLFSMIIIVSLCVLFSCNKDEEMSPEEEECSQITWYEDSDGDGFGNSDSSILACAQPSEYVSDSSDFDDTDSSSYPGAEEICDDNIDNNGNGEIDECGIVNSITGVWTDNFGNAYTIDGSNLTESTNGYIYHILVSGSDFIICQNDSENPFFGDLYTKFVFTDVLADEFYYCLSFYDSPSQQFIEDSIEPSNFDDLAGGCDGFPWGRMTRD